MALILYETERSVGKNYIYVQNDTCLAFQKHAHYSFEVICVVDGEIDCEVDGTSYSLQINDVLLIFPGQVHSYETRKYSRTSLCIFSTDLVADFYAETNGMVPDCPVVNINQLGGFIEEFNDGNIFIKKSVLYKLCGVLYKTSGMHRVGTANYHLASRIALYVQTNYPKQVTLHSIASELGYSYTYLSNFFNQQFGMRFSEYVNAFRLQHAARLLVSGNERITEIAFESGFGTIRSFNSSFKSRYGITPREYRNTVSAD